MNEGRRKEEAPPIWQGLFYVSATTVLLHGVECGELVRRDVTVDIDNHTLILVYRRHDERLGVAIVVHVAEQEDGLALFLFLSQFAILVLEALYLLEESGL